MVPPRGILYSILVRNRSFLISSVMIPGVRKILEKIVDVSLTSESFFVEFPFNRTVEITIFLNEGFQGHVFSTSYLILGAGYRRKILKRNPYVSLSSINRWCEFQIFSSISYSE